MGGRGLPSYPHPRALPEFWEFTGGPIATLGSVTGGSGYTASGTYTEVPLTGSISGAIDAQATIVVSGGAVTSATLTFGGGVIGGIAGYYGGWVDAVLMRIVDVVLSIPTFYLILMVIAFLGPNIMNVMVIIGLTSWTDVARLVRGEVLSLKEREFVQAAKVIGMKDVRIIMKHILPNAMGPILVVATLGIGGVILLESSLSFLGLGVQPPTPSWGNMLEEGKDHLTDAWWLVTFPGLAIFITVLGYNLLGQGMRDLLDPRLRGSGRNG